MWAALWLVVTLYDLFSVLLLLLLLTRAVKELSGIKWLSHAHTRHRATSGGCGAYLSFLRGLVVVIGTTTGRLLLLFHVFHQDVCGVRIEDLPQEVEEHVRDEQHEGEDDEDVDWL